MAIRPVLLYSNDLRQKCAPVTDFGDGLKWLVADLFDTMVKHEGVGLAAPQVAVFKRVAVIDFMRERKAPDQSTEKLRERWVLVNPIIEEESGKASTGEGCLSVPGFRFPVNRPAELVCSFQNEFGEWKRIVAEGLLARAISHEVGHLNGELLVDRTSGVFRDIFNRRWKKKNAVEHFLSKGGYVANASAQG